MRKTHFVMCMLFGMFVHAQDTLPKIKLKLFDANLFLGFTISPTPSVNLAYIASAMEHKEYATGDFVKGYSDTVRRPRRLHGFGPAFSGHLGISASFQFANAKSKFLKRIKPRFGIYHSYQKIYEGTVSYNKAATDSIIAVNPTMPADSVLYGQIAYNYFRKSIYFEAGANVDIIVTKRIIIYSGILFGYGIGYSNRSSVSKYEIYDEASNFKQIHNEPVNYASRITIPMGVQHRFALKHQFSASFFGEARLGIDFDKLKYGSSAAGVFYAMNAGVRFSFRYHK